MNPYATALELLNKDKYRESEKILHHLANDEFDNPLIEMALGMIFLNQGKNGLAVALLKYASSRLQDPTPHYDKLSIKFPKTDKRVLGKRVLAKCYSGIGVACRNQNKMKDARRWFDRAIALEPNDSGILSNFSTMFLNEGDPKTAIKYLERALELNPEDNDASWNLALAQLELKDWAHGWDNHDKGTRGRKVTLARTYRYPDGTELPMWDGTPDKTILIYGEQGIGDEIMFSSCVPDLKKISKQVVFDVHKRLKTLFDKAFEIDCHPTREDEWIDWPVNYKFDFRCPIGSLPKFFRRTDEAFPGMPYLQAVGEPPEVLKPLKRLKVGISWIGGLKQARIDVRAIPLEELLPILKEDCDFVSLQYTDCQSEVDDFEQKHGIKLNHHTEIVKAEDYNETAKLVSGLDLVISVCTSVIHLSGAMGVPCWVLVPDRPAWRYGVQGNMPWYESVKLLRQRKGDPWSVVINQTAERLNKLVSLKAAA